MTSQGPIRVLLLFHLDMHKMHGDHLIKRFHWIAIHCLVQLLPGISDYFMVLKGYKEFPFDILQHQTKNNLF